MSHLLTNEIRSQIAAHNSWMLNREGAEPFNPWPQLVSQIVKEIECFPIGWGSHEEIVTDFIEHDYVVSLYAHIYSRYEARAWDADSIVNVLCKHVELCELS